MCMPVLFRKIFYMCANEGSNYGKWSNIQSVAKKVKGYAGVLKAI